MSVHSCHAIGCEAVVPPARFACLRHWRMLPKPLRDGVWRAYRPGQERDKQPSAVYLDAAHAAIHWLHEAEGLPPRFRCRVCAEATA
jgi:hypothetical protein